MVLSVRSDSAHHGHLAMSGNIFDSHNVGVEGGCYWHVGAAPRDAAIRPITHRAAPTTEDCLTPSINSAEVEKPCSGHMLVSLLKPSSFTLPPGNSWEEFWAPLKLFLLQEVFPACPTPQVWPTHICPAVPSFRASVVPARGLSGRPPCPQGPAA